MIKVTIKSIWKKFKACINKPISVIKLFGKSIWKKSSTCLNKVGKVIKKLVEYMKSYTGDYNKTDLKYEDLAPKDDVLKADAYLTALDWALSNDKIYNIALTGSYGSGKSSILNTYQKNRSHNHYLNISLASFYDNQKTDIPIIGEDNKDQNSTKDSIVNFEDLEIEKSILQQMFYKVKHSKIPYSRFRKLKNTTYKKIFGILLVTLLTVVLGSIVLFPNVINNLSNNYDIFIKTYKFNKIIIISLYGIFGLLILVELAFVIRYFSTKIRLSKLSFQKLELETDKLNEDCVFNKYLDEILYYFEVTKYNVVFIEDLDRFNNTRIFIKLRELNSLLNNSEQINRKIVFIYAIKDDMFKNKERTKFFDFIIPVIPVINSSNSGNKLLEKIEKGKFETEISKEYINAISVYIDDMRVLTNIYNEFVLYKNILTDVSLKSILIFSLIVYKNLYPNDFAELQYGRGLVYKAFESKKEFITKQVNNLKKERKELQIKLESIESDTLASIVELKSSLIYNMMDGFYNVTEICEGNKSYPIEKYMKDSFDLSTLADKELNIRYNIGHYNNRSMPSSLKKADSKSGSEKTFLERWNYLKGMSLKHKEELKNKIEDNKKEESELVSKKLKYLLNMYNIKEVLIDDVFKEKPIAYLLRNGYIDETYENYLTYFYPNSLTAKDMNFILGIRNHEGFEFSYELTKIKQIFYKLNEHEYRQPEILNIALLDYLFTDIDKYQTEIKTIICQLANETETSFSFINEFYKVSDKNREMFFKMVCHEWYNIWAYINLQPDIPLEEKHEYLIRIIKHADIEDIVNINKYTNAESYVDDVEITILAKPDFFRLTRDIKFEKLKDVIKEFDLYFENINPYDEDKEILDFIFDNCFYDININMLKIVIERKSKKDYSRLFEANLTTILNSEYKPLISYIYDNVDNFKYYITHVFLKLDTNTKEDVQTIIDILKRDLDDEIRIQIIQKELFVIDDLDLIDKPLWGELLKEDKVKPTWSSIFKFFAEHNNQNDVLFVYIKRNWNSLVNSEYIDELPEDEDFQQSFMKNLLVADLPDDCYESLTNMFGIKVENFDISSLKNNQIRILIKNCYFELEENKFLAIKENFSGMHIDYLLSYKDNYITDLDNYKIDSNDLELLLKRSVLVPEDKLNLVSRVPNTLITKNIAKQICGFIDNTMKISENLFNIVWEQLVSREDKIKLMIRQIENMSNEKITHCLNALNGDYADITQPGKRVKIEYSDIIFSLAESLDKIDYISSKDVIEREDPILPLTKKYVQFNTKRKMVL